MALLFDDYEYQPEGTAAAKKTTSFFDSIQALITRPKFEPIQSEPSGYSASPQYAPLDDGAGNIWVDTPGGGGHWRAADGRIWSDSANSWVEDPTAAIAAVSGIGNAATPTRTWEQPSYSAGWGSGDSAFDEMQTQNNQQMDWQSKLNATVGHNVLEGRSQPWEYLAASDLGAFNSKYGLLSDIYKGAGKVAGWANFQTPSQYSLPPLDVNLTGEDPTGWNGQPKNAFGNNLATNRDPGLGISQFLDKTGASGAYDWYTKNIQTPFAETASQLTGPVIRTGGAAIPGMTGALAGAQALTGWKPDFGGIGQLADTVSNTRSFSDFRDQQNEKFAARPIGQQLLASTIYDPTNLAGAGWGTAALKSGAVTSRIARGLATADKALDVAQTRLAAPLIGGAVGFGASAMTGGDTNDNLIAAVIGATGATVAPKVVQKVVGQAAVKAGTDAGVAYQLKAIGREYGLNSPSEIFAAAVRDGAAGGQSGLFARVQAVIAGEEGAAYIPSPGEFGALAKGGLKVADSAYDIASSPADLLARAYGKIPGLAGEAAPVDQLGVESILDVRTAKGGLTPTERIANWVREKTGGRIGGDVMNDPRAQPIIHEMGRDYDIVDSQASRLAHKARSVLSKFDIDKHGIIQDTELFDDQVEAIRALGGELAQYRDAGVALGRKIGVRPGIAETPLPISQINPQGLDIRDLADQLGVYLPRGRPVEDGTEEIVKLSAGGRRGGKAAAEKSAVYDSVAQGIANGEVYPSLTEAVQSYAQGFGRALAEQHAANQVLALTDSAGARLAQTAADRVPQKLRETHDDLVKRLASLRRRVATAEKRLNITSATHDELDDALARIEKTKPDETRPMAKIPKAVEKLDAKAEKLRTEKFGKPSGEPVRVKMPISSEDAARAGGIEEVLGKLEELIPDDLERIRFLDSAVQATQRRLDVLGKRRTGKFMELDALGKELTDVEDMVKDITPKWRDAVARSKAVPRDQGTIGLATLSPYSLPVEISNAFNKALKDMAPISGRGSRLVTVPEAVNSILRNVRASIDISFLGVQGLIGAVKDPAAYAKAVEVAFHALADPAAFGRYLVDFEKRLPTGVTSQDVARYVRTAGDETEFTNPLLGKLPFFKQGNRGFAQFGDALRYELFANALEVAGKNSSDERFLEGLGKAVNRVTGTTKKGFGGDLGAITMFAPRFFQSQLETVGKALADGTIEGDYARSSLLRLIGTGAATTVAVNAALGNETDFDVNSPNFMRVRMGGQDVSFFGPWDSLVKAMVAMSPVESVGRDGVDTKMPDPAYLLRTKASPLAGLVWDQVTGKNFMGQDSRPWESRYGFDNFMRGFLPISLSEIGKGEGQGIGKTLAGVTGLKATPMTERERREAASGKGGTPYSKMTPREQQEYDAKHGEIKSESDYAKRAEQIDEQRLANEAGAVTKFLPGGGLPEREDFRNRVSEIQREAALAKKEALLNLGTFSTEKPSDPLKAALWEYYDSYNAKDISGATDFDAQAKKLADYEAKWTPEQKKYVDERRVTEHVPAVQELVDAKKKLGDAGFWDIYDNAWATYQKKYADHSSSKYESYEDWYNTQVNNVKAEVLKKNPTFDEAQAIDIARGEVGKSGTAKEFDKMKTAEKEKWVVANKPTGLAALAFKWEYLTANKDRKYIFDEPD